MKSKLLAILSTLLYAVLSTVVLSQTKINVAENMQSEGTFYTKDGVLYTDAIVVKFKACVIDTTAGIRVVGKSSVRNEYPATKNLINKLEGTYGNIEIRKQVPRAKWGDVMRENRITKAQVRIHDYSQLFTIKFSSPVPLQKTIDELLQVPEVEYAHQPILIEYQVAPNDPYYNSSDQWNLYAVNAQAAWNVTHGSSSIHVAIVDRGIYESHPDLVGKITTRTVHYADEHGTVCAGIVGATTNNSTGVASLGWNIMVGNYCDGDSTSLSDSSLINRIFDACEEGCQVINCSWITLQVLSVGAYDAYCPTCPRTPTNYRYRWLGSETENRNGVAIAYNNPEMEAIISDAIGWGVVVVAAAGNHTVNSQIVGAGDEAQCDPGLKPFQAWPAS